MIRASQEVISFKKRIFAKPGTDCAVLQQKVKNYNNKTGNCVYAYSVFYGLF